MLAKYCRFYSVSDDYVMRMPVKRFFLLYRQIRRIQAEETLVLLRVISQPYIDPKKNRGDTFVDNLREAAGLEPVKRVVPLNSARDMKDWGIGFKKVKKEPEQAPPAEKKGFTFKRKT